MSRSGESDTTRVLTLENSLSMVAPSPVAVEATTGVEAWSFRTTM